MSNFDLDPDTGMPLLPEGQFWRVQQHYEDDYSTAVWGGRVFRELKQDTRVSLMERYETTEVTISYGIFRQEKQVVEEKEVRYEKTGGLNPDPRRISDTAVKILRQMEWSKERQEKARVEQESRERFYGDYPPKNLNEVL